MIMKEIGLSGQERLKGARVLMIGTGGLGSPAALYLSGAGVGTLGLVDADTVDESNLHRQVIHMEDRVNMPKVLSAKAQIEKFNHRINVETYQTAFNAQNAAEILSKGWDVVMDGSDNAATRYLVSDACVIAKKILVSGSCLQWEGQVTVYNYQGGPCYRCLFPKAPPAGAIADCSSGGVLGTVPGLIGQLQATEIIKIILGKGEVLNQRMVVYDALDMRFRNVKLRGRNAECVTCGDKPTVTDVKQFDYDDFCQTGCTLASRIKLPADNTMTIKDFYKVREEAGDKKLCVVDVRPKVQYDITNLPESVNLPWPELPRKPQPLLDICKEQETVYVMCRRGRASKEATDWLIKEHGVKHAINVEGGMNALSLLDEAYPLY